MIIPGAKTEKENKMLKLTITGKQFKEFCLRMEDEFYIEDMDAININVEVFGTEKFQNICNELHIDWMFGVVLGTCIMENEGLRTCSVNFDQHFKDGRKYNFIYDANLLEWEVKELG